MSSTPSPAPTRNGARRKGLVWVTAVVLAGGTLGIAWWALVLRHAESTDNAYVQGNVVQITPQVAGTVAAVGPGVTRYKAGDAVCALTNGGGYAEYCLAEETATLPVPAGLAPVEFYAELTKHADEIDQTQWNAAEFAGDFKLRIQEPAAHAASIVTKWPYLTRMFTTISPSEMTEDPIPRPAGARDRATYEHGGSPHQLLRRDDNGAGGRQESRHRSGDGILAGLGQRHALGRIHRGVLPRR